MSERTRILIVDDDPGVRKTLSDILANQGFAPLAVSSGKAALEVAPGQMPIIALIDLRLRDMSGLELMRELKKFSPNIECIVVTGHASQTSAIDAINLGAYSYVQKPYDLPQLLLTIRRAIERRSSGEALKFSEDRYRDLVEHSQDLICTHDLE
jgi:two-component system response regulator HydG